MKGMRLDRTVAQRIVERVATGLDKPLSVADASAHIVASTAPELVGGWCAPAARVIATKAVVEDADGFVGIGTPLCYGDQVIGALLLSDAAHHRRELAQVSKTLAELIIHQATVIEQLPRQAWARDKFISDLLHERLNDSPELVRQEAALLMIDLARPRVVVAVETEQAARPPAQRELGRAGLPLVEQQIRSEQHGDELIQSARQAITAHPDDVFGLIDERRLVLLAVIDPRAIEARRRQIADDVQRFLDRLGVHAGMRASAGVGRYYPGWPGLAQSFADARFALETGARLHGLGRTFCVEELGLASFVCSDDPTLKAALARRLLQPIAADRELLDTLAAFFDADLSPSATAQALHIHRHTLAYRLDKITQITSLNPRQFEAASQLRAALLLHKLNGSFAA
jgi:carbohydrate diacid regulator